MHVALQHYKTVKCFITQHVTQFFGINFTDEYMWLNNHYPENIPNAVNSLHHLEKNLLAFVVLLFNSNLFSLHMLTELPTNFQN